MIHSIGKKVSKIFHSLIAEEAKQSSSLSLQTQSKSIYFSVIARFSPENRGNPVYALLLTRLPRRFAPRNDKLGKYVHAMTSWSEIS